MSWWCVGVTISPAILMVTRDCFKSCTSRLYYTNLFIVSVYDGSSLHDQIYCPCWKYSWVIVLWCESTERIEIAVSLRTCWLCVSRSDKLFRACPDRSCKKKLSFLGDLFWYLVNLTHLRTLCSHIAAMTHPSTLVSCCLHDRSPYSQHCCGHEAPPLVFETGTATARFRLPLLDIVAGELGPQSVFACQLFGLLCRIAVSSMSHVATHCWCLHTG